MSKKLILILAAVATTAFTLAYAVTVWAYGGGCCGFCGFQLTRTDAASRCYEAQLCRQCFYIALEGIVMRRGRVLLLVIAVLVVSAVAGVVTALYRLGKLAPQPIASRGPTRSRRRSLPVSFRHHLPANLPSLQIFKIDFSSLYLGPVSVRVESRFRSVGRYISGGTISYNIL